MYSLTYIMILIFTGIGVGFFSGLIGVGGCFIMVPVQFWLLKSIGIPVDIAIRVAFGTNLFVVLPTALSGAISHKKKDSVDIKASMIVGIVGMFSAFLGGYIATKLSGNTLKTFFAIVILFGALRMIFSKSIRLQPHHKGSTVSYIIVGIIIGIVSGIIGIGGGVIVIPLLVIFLGFSMHLAVGTSTALMVFTSFGGMVSYIVNGLGVKGLPPFSIGYVNLFQWFLLASTSIPMAYLGAKLAHKLHPKHLKTIFIVIMVYMALKMLGIGL